MMRAKNEIPFLVALTVLQVWLEVPGLGSPRLLSFFAFGALNALNGNQRKAKGIRLNKEDFASVRAWILPKENFYAD